MGFSGLNWLIGWSYLQCLDICISRFVWNNLYLFSLCTYWHWLFKILLLIWPRYIKFVYLIIHLSSNRLYFLFYFIKWVISNRIDCHIYNIWINNSVLNWFFNHGSNWRLTHKASLLLLLNKFVFDYIDELIHWHFSV